MHAAADHNPQLESVVEPIVKRKFQKVLPCLARGIGIASPVGVTGWHNMVETLTQYAAFEIHLDGDGGMVIHDDCYYRTLRQYHIHILERSRILHI